MHNRVVAIQKLSNKLDNDSSCNNGTNPRGYVYKIFFQLPRVKLLPKSAPLSLR